MFAEDINENFVQYMWIQGAINIICLVFPPVFVEVPVRLQSNFFSWFRSRFKETEFRHSITRDEIDILMRTSTASIHFNADISRSFREGFLEEETFFFEEKNSNAK